MFLFYILFSVQILANDKFPVDSIPSFSIPPPIRTYHVSLYLPDTDQIALFGGYVNIDLFYNDLWVYSFDTSSWDNLVSVNPTIPSK